ncbi:MAG: glycoside hydrolase domain-containing protein, partial [Armatimonadota bacterium]
MRQVRLTGTFFAAAVLVGLVCTSAAYAQQLTPPLLQIGQIDAITVDGRIGDAEWAGATEVGLFVGADGWPADLPAKVRLAWDESGLAVLWELTGTPEYKRRDRDAAIWRDDSVEIHLQAEEGDPVHRFGVSAGGSVRDARGDDVSWDAVWRALALRATDSWRVEMHIPFAAFGARPGSTIRANLAVNDGETDMPAAAWAVPADGDGFGLLRLAATPAPVTLRDVTIDRDTATVFPRFSGPGILNATLFEADTEVQASECSETAPLEITLPHPGEFRLRLAGMGPDGELVLQREFSLVRTPPMVVTSRKRLLSAREIDLTIDGAGLTETPDRYVISAPGAEAVEMIPGPDRIGRGTLDLSRCAVGELTVTATALAEGRELASETLTFELPPRPEWAGSARGKHGRLMAPWSPVQVRGNRVECWDRVYDLGDHFLPVRITSGRKNLLAGPVSLRATVGDSLRRWNQSTVRWVETTDRHAVATITAESALAEARVRATVDYDGLMTFNLRVNPRGDRSLSEIRLEVPVAAEFATHLQISDGTEEGLVAAATGHEGYTGEFAPMVSLSGRERGLQWLCASDHAWSLEDPSEAIAIARGRGSVRLAVTMLDRELLPGEAFETSFSLQATPVRPKPEGRRDWRTATLPELPMTDGVCDAAVIDALRERGVSTVVLDDESFRPRPDGRGEAADAVLREFAELCHQAGMRLMLVIDDDLTRDAVWDAFRDEVASVPTAEGAPVRPCPGSAWADYVVEAAAYAMSEYDADGIHLRGGATVRGCASEMHQGAGCALTGARELMMRLRTVVHEAGPDALLTVELPAGTPAHAAGFADGLVIEGVADEAAVARLVRQVP